MQRDVLFVAITMAISAVLVPLGCASADRGGYHYQQAPMVVREQGSAGNNPTGVAPKQSTTAKQDEAAAPTKAPTSENRDAKVTAPTPAPATATQSTNPQQLPQVLAETGRPEQWFALLAALWTAMGGLLILRRRAH